MLLDKRCVCLTPREHLAPRGAEAACSLLCWGLRLRRTTSRQHLKGCSEEGGGLAQTRDTPWAAAPRPAGCCCRGSMSPLSRVPSTAGTGLSHRAAAQGCSWPHATPVPGWSWPPAALEPPGLGTALSALPSRFLSGTRARKPVHGSLTPWGEGTSPGQGGLMSPLLYCLGDHRPVQEWGTSAFAPKFTSLGHRRCGCAVPKRAKHARPLNRGPIIRQAGTGAAVRGRAEGQGTLPRQAGSRVCCTRLPH